MSDDDRRGFRDFIDWLFALRIIPSERLVFVDDPYNIFSEDVSRRRPLLVAFVLGLLFHLFLILMVWPHLGNTDLPLTTEKFVIKELARPSLPEGAAGQQAEPPPKPEPVVPQSKPKPIPIPDPTPNAPEPILQATLDVPKVLEELTLDLSVGEIEAPPGAGRSRGRDQGDGLGRQGTGSGAGGRDGVFRVGGDVSMPQLLVKTTPAYTDDAIKAKVQGVVLLRGVVRKNGRVDSLSVVRGLGYGLEENAIREIASKWKFRPGMRNGQAVDVWATIEVTFNLR